MEIQEIQTERHEIGRSAKVGKDLQETVTDSEQRDKLWYKTAVSGDKLRWSTEA